MSADGSQAAIQAFGRPLILIDFRALNYRRLSLNARPVAWSPDARRLLVAHEPAPGAPWPLHSVLSLANAGVPCSCPPRAKHRTSGQYYHWLSDSPVFGIDQKPSRVLVVDVSGASPKVVTNEMVESGGSTLSPGKLLAEAKGGLQAPASLSVYKLDPFERVNEITGLTFAGSQMESRAVWTNDSTRLPAVRDVCTSGENLVLVNAQTGSETRVVQSDPIALGPLARRPLGRLHVRDRAIHYAGRRFVGRGIRLPAGSRSGGAQLVARWPVHRLRPLLRWVRQMPLTLLAFSESLFAI